MISKGKYHISAYEEFLPPELLAELVENYSEVPGVSDFKIDPELVKRFSHIETAEALNFVLEIYRQNKDGLNKILSQRKVDRFEMDKATLVCLAKNLDTDYLSQDYKTILGLKDSEGRLIIGPHETECAPNWQVDIPDYLSGDQVTLFGPPDTKRMSVNAMNAIHRRLPNEPEIVTELIEATKEFPKWGADNEDSKTPLMSDFLLACENLMECYRGSLKFDDERTGKKYRLESDRLARPIKRFPGLAIPDMAHVYQGSPLPLHLYDFALHMYHNWKYREALCFYVPKLENEEEATYIYNMIDSAEKLIKSQHPEYEMGQVKLYIVFESPRSIFRIREIAKVLHPYFVGGSLGWHDFLAATARMFKHDPNYRIPVKADPNIVINHIRESHKILEQSLAPIGAIKIGGMYGVLHEHGNDESFQVTMIGYIKDVVTQLKRGLDGFWVAHPDFVRIGLALVEAYRRQDDSLNKMIDGLITDPTDQKYLKDFILGPDIKGLERDHYLYERGVLAASLKESDVISNSDPKEIRYNIFQAIQYLADWLRGNGCVALPASLRHHSGKEVRVRVMDDLATTERSRWEVWAEVHHGRVSMELFEQILAEEIAFIKADKVTESRAVQVKWEGECAKWYPVATHLLRLLMTDANPVEFVPELLLPFLAKPLRDSDDPWKIACERWPAKYH